MKHPALGLHEVSDEIYEVSNLLIEDFSACRLWLFDLEATGLDTTRERVTQVAGIPFVGGRLIEEEAFSEYVFPGEGIEMSQEVQELTGITPETLRGKRPLPEVWRACLKAARGCDYWVGQSVFEFDVPLLETELARHSMPVELPPILDSVVLATALLGEPATRWSTSALIQRFNVDVGELRRHDALNDVKILGLIVDKLGELIRSEHDNRVHIPPDKRIPIRRHPPVRG